MKLISPATKLSAKDERERKVLLALIEYYLKTGRPVGSNTLKDVGFANLSSATIRNYFAHLEEEGYLLQQHTSGGRIPTNKAYKLYAQELLLANEQANNTSTQNLEQLRTRETKAIASFLQNAAESLSEATGLAAFLSAPRFEQDFVIGIRFLPLDADRCLCALITDFGEVITEVLHLGQKLSNFASKRIEGYFNWRLHGIDKPENLTPQEEEYALKLYNEVMVRYIVSYTQFESEDIYRTGFSKLLAFAEFHEPSLLANSLALFEHAPGMRLLLKDCSKHKALKFWIGEDLKPFVPHTDPDCTVIAIPYCVNGQPVGSIGVLGPTRIPYGQLFSILRDFSESISESLTNNLYKFKIAMRQPKPTVLEQENKERLLLTKGQRLLLEQTVSSKK